MSELISWGKRACAVFLLCATAAIAVPAQTFTTLHSFNGTDGANPDAALFQGTDGSLYGTTNGGGANGNYGTVFKITASGALTTLHSFCAQSACTDGEYPYAALVQATNGDFYGTTLGGGANGGGTVFKITPSGALTTLYSFCAQTVCTDGSSPYGLVQAANGDFYGTTNAGGANPGPNSTGGGTVFKITPSGKLTTLYSFCAQTGCTDGEYPQAALVQAYNGDLYGTTAQGGANGGGTVFKITPSGTPATLYSFCAQSGCTDGEYPQAALVQASNGDFYGTTFVGGSNFYYGTVFKISPTGTLTTLYSFCPQIGCGYYLTAGLVQATNGDFYGTTQQGGAANDGGTVFKISPSGKLMTLYSFCAQSGCPDGQNPSPGLVQDTNGSFYGTTVAGGANGDGTIFRLFVGLVPFVKTQPTSGKVGTVVKILGTNLTGAGSVSFNGTAADFTIVSPSLIKTTVPAGATTGEVQVTTPGATLLSNVAFRVRP